MSESNDALDVLGPKILTPYARDPDSQRERRRRTVLTASVMLFCIIYGSAFALFGSTVLMVFLVPVAVLALLVIWALPMRSRAPVGALETLFFSFFIVLIIWPNYIALALPGLPWITASRITGLPLFVVLLICLSSSRNFLSQVADALRAVPIVSVMLCAFVIIQTYSIALSSEKGLSIDKFITDQTTWTAMAIIGAYVFQKPGRVKQWVYVLWGMAIVTGIIGVFEYHNKQLLWAGHIPQILAVQDPTLAKELGATTADTPGTFGSLRGYRTQSTFGTSIDFAEYLSYTVPFLLHFVCRPFRLPIRAAAAVSIPFLALAVHLTGSRSGTVGFLVAALSYLLYWGVRRWRSNRESLIGPAVVLCYPLVGVASLASILVVGRVRKMVLGGGAASISAQARVQQWRLGMPKIIHNPLGYGIGQGAATVGWSTPDGFWSIDTFYLLITVEYGILGFLVFFGMIIAAIIEAGRVAFFEDSADEEISFLMPAAIVLLNFFIIRGVFSQQNNIPVVYMVLGMVCALILRYKTEKRLKSPPVTEPVRSAPSVRATGRRRRPAPSLAGA